MPAPVTIGILSDTHIPDRCPGLNPAIERRFRAESVSAILHGGDVCIPSVLDILRLIAPVYAVKGNRDIYLLRGLPNQLTLEFNGIKIGLSHGHGGLRDYLGDKILKYTGRLDIGHIQRRSAMAFNDVKVNIFGHMHQPFLEWIGETLFLGPGSACSQDNKKLPPSAALLHIGANGEVSGEIFFLD